MLAKTPHRKIRGQESEAQDASATARPGRPELELASAVRELPSGRRVVISVSGGGEELMVHSPAGELEVRIAFTADGPVVALSGARLELAALDEVAVRCRRFAVTASEGAHLESRGPIEVEAGGNLRLDGEQIFLNCDPGFSGTDSEK